MIAFVGMNHKIRQMKKLTTLMAAALLFCGCHGTPDIPSPPAPSDAASKAKTRTDSVGMLVTAVRGSSKMYTSEFRVHKIITHNDALKLKGSILGMSYKFDLPAGSRRIAIPIDATLKGYIDFANFNSDNVIFDDGKIELILPDPQVELTSTKINHDEIESYVALLRSDFTDQELSAYEIQGRDSILASIPDLKIAERTRQSASRLLIPMIRQLGFTDDEIVVTFRKDFDERQLRTNFD